MKFISWNVNGLRACMQKGFLDFFQEIDADIFCLQETKLGNSGHGGPFFDMAMVVREGHAAGASSDPLTLRPLYYVYEEEGEAWPRRCPRREPLRFESMRPAMVRATPPTMGGVIGSPSTRAEAAPVSAGTR